uniref:Uncharacterized protein n=1 Tax=Arcella intermedia TaxID=1963864 RepID=A0A6B2LGL2_9EUKA
MARTENEKRLMYSMVLTRMVNGIVAPFHGSSAVSIRTVALKLELPESLIEIRHQASHSGNLPPLPVLRRVAQQALDWTKERYWETQRRKLEEVKEKVKDILRQYYNFQKKRTEKDLDKKEKQSIGNRQKQCLIQIKEICAPSHVNLILIPFLVDDNLLIPKKK